MWPWGHLAFGYVLFSLASRAWFDEPPRGPSVYVLVVATQLPDLVDKTLSWVLGVFPTGYSVAHSVFVAVPAGIVVALVAWRRGRPAAGVAFAVGLWSHLLGDVIVGALTPGTYEVQMGAVERALYYFAQFVAELRTGEDPTLLLLYFGPFLAAFVIWIVDGMPGFPWIRRRTMRTP